MHGEPDEEWAEENREYERLERENRERVIHGTLDFLGVVVGGVCILALVLLLISLLNWLKNDLQNGLALFFG